jgi:hypothetical protein
MNKVLIEHLAKEFGGWDVRFTGTTRVDLHFPNPFMSTLFQANMESTYGKDITVLNHRINDTNMTIKVVVVFKP